MAVTHERRLVLFAAAQTEREQMRQLFASDCVADWEMIEADCVERTHFLLQMNPCDVLLLDNHLPGLDGAALTWLAGQGRTPLLFLAENDADIIANALEQGVHQWLPRELVMSRPALLAAALRQVERFGNLRRRMQRTDEALRESRQQVSRLVSLLWDVAPNQGRALWFSQRYMMERLHEEVARTRRHGGALSVVLGEIQVAEHEQVSASTAQRLTTWTSERIIQTKRRSDVAGQYGLHGFMLLLPRLTQQEATYCCQRLRPLLEQPSVAATGPYPPLHVRFGIASFSPQASTVQGLLSQAEERLDDNLV